LIATAASREILRDFKAANVEYPLAVHLTGKFKTAFPDGPPRLALASNANANPRTAASVGTNAPAADSAQLKECSAGSEVVLVADTDMLNDKVCVRVQNIMGHRIVRPMNGNLNFVQSVVEQFAGDDDLIGARSRACMSRPFTRVKDMEAKAAKQWEEKVQILETRQREMEQKVKELQMRPGGPDGREESVILSPEQEKELEKYQQTLVEVGKDLKQVRKNLRKDTDALEFRTKIINIGAMPAMVTMSGFGLAAIKIKRRAAR